MRIVATALGLSLLVAACAWKKDRIDDSPFPDASEPTTDSQQEQASESASLDEQQSQLDQEVRAYTLGQQKTNFLIGQHLEKARAFKNELRFQQAKVEVARALELAPDNLQAKELAAEIGALLGDPGGQAQTVIQSLEDLYLLKREQAEADAREKVKRAQLMIGREEFDQAIVELNLALDQIRLYPYSGDWKELETSVEEQLQSVRTTKEEADRRRDALAEQSAREELRERERADTERRENEIDSLLNRAIDSFRTKQYQTAITYADRVLRLQPRNRKALDLHDTAFRKERQLVNDNHLQDKLEQYARWKEELEELRIPYLGVVTLPDEDEWRRITKLRANRAGFGLGRTVSAGELELRERIADTLIPGLQITDEESLTTVIRAIQTITGLPIVTDPLADEAAVNAGVIFEFNFTNPLSVEKSLNLITEEAGEEVTWTIRHEAILVTTVEKARGELVIVNHDVQDLIFPLSNFIGPRIGKLRLIDQLEDDDGGSPFGSLAERTVVNDPDNLVELVTQNVEPGSWEAPVSLSLEGGNMVIVHTPEVQEKVRAFLEELRRFSSSLVTIESKFLAISEGFLQEIGVDWRGLDNPGDPFTDLDDLNLDLDPTRGLDNSGDGATLIPPSSGAYLDEGGDGDLKLRTENFFTSALGSTLTNIGGLTAQWHLIDDLQASIILRLVEKSENIELINNQMLSVHNTQRAHVTVINQKAYVQDFDVEVAQFQAVADPVVNVLTEGIVLDVRPTIQHNRSYLTLEIQPTVAQVVSLTDFSTTLAGQTAAVTFQLPELEVQSVFTTAVIPDGGSILLGGLSRIRNIERRAEVPWLANIPLLGFFFKQEGYSDERESLMILLKAWITHVKEELARLER
jgi:general secretion pathway protein D